MSYQAIQRHGGNRYISLNERSWYEKAMHYVISSMWYFGKSITVKAIKGSVVARDGEQGERNRWGTENLGGGTDLYDTVMVDTCHYTLVPIHGMYNNNVNVQHYNVNYTLWVITMFNIGSSLVTNVQLWWEMLIIGETIGKE